jgi:Na+/proline symporter
VAVAYGYGDLVALLGTFAFGTFAAALAPVLAIGLNWRGATAVGAAASIATGLAANFALETLSRSGSIPALAPGISPAIALSLSTAVLLAVSMTTRPPANGLAEEIDAVMSM